MKGKRFFLKDSEINDWLISGFSQRNFPITFMGIYKNSQSLSKSRLGRILILHIQYIRLAFKVLIKSKKSNTIVCYLDVLGLYVFLFSKILIKKRNIVVINVMFNSQNDFITNIKYHLYKFMLKDKHIYPTVSSKNLSGFYRNFFNLPTKKFYVLHDCYGKLVEYKRNYTAGENYVFCGGTNGRDWKTLVKIASLLPNTKFIIVGPNKNTLGLNYPKNIEYYYDISFDKFQQLIEKSSILALPLNTEAPAGLIVLFTAGLMSKPVITTDNITMKEYITSKKDGVLIKIGDYNNFANEIKNLISNPEKQKYYGENLFTTIEKLGSPLAFIDKLINIISQIESK